MIAEIKVEDPIKHLDFDPEKEEDEEGEENEIHYAHPTDPLIYWCGKISRSPGFSGRTVGPREITCVACLHEYAEKGSAWWWKVHRAWHET